MTIKEQAAYLKGLLSGMELDDEKNETKLFKGIVDIIQNISSSVEDLDQDVDGILEQLEVMDEDLASVENEVFEDGCGCDCDCDCGCDCDEDCDCNCGCHGDADCYEVICPDCGKQVCLCSETLKEKEMNCPNCGQLLEFDLSDCCGCEGDCDDDCNCGCKSQD